MSAFETNAVQGARVQSYEGALCVPIFQSATFCGSEGYSYSRLSNPTRTELEHTAALLEGGTEAFAFSSGLAACSAVFSLLQSGDEVLISDGLYGGTYRLITKIFSGFGITFRFADLTDPTQLNATEKTKLLFFETPTNPILRVLPIRTLTEWASKNGILSVVDNTFLTPYFQKPLSLGADMVLHSGTKYLSGHHDTSCGLLVVKDDPLSERLHLLQSTLGNALAPSDAFLTLRGMQTLHLRMERHEQNAHAVAEFLSGHPRVERVFYPGLPNDPGHDLMKEQSSGFGGMVSFRLQDGDVQALLHGGRYIRFAESLGGTVSLITHPKTQTHASVPERVRLKMGVDQKLLRLSVGLEHIDDLLEDLDRMLQMRTT